MRFLNKDKVLLLTALVFILTLSIAPLALAEGYNWPQQYTASTGYPQGPHGGYTTTTNKCKECHAVHLATGSFMLTRANSRGAACDFCHGVGGPGIGLKISLNAEGHGLSAAQENSTTVVAPDDTTPSFKIQPIKWGCPDCHSVHDNGTVLLAGYSTTKLLKKDPNPGKTYKYYSVPTTRETTQTTSHWCSTCHNANFGLHTDPKQIEGYSGSVYGHDTSGQGVATDTAGKVIVDPNNQIASIPANSGPTCKQCHKADGTGGHFPHSSENTPTVSGTATAPDMLQQGTKPNQLDSVCSSCHHTPSLP